VVEAVTLRQQLAFITIRRRLRLVRVLLREPWQRDFAGQLLANLVALARLVPVALWDARLGRPTEVELRAVRNARRRVMARLHDVHSSTSR
jgi:hypothetical protein